MKTIHKLLILFLSVSFFTACSDKDSGPSGDPLKMTASSDTIILSEADLSKEVLTFTWNKGLDMEPGYYVDYIYRLDLATGDYTNSTPPEFFGNETFSRSYTAQELNDTITEKWGIKAGEAVELQARVCAKVFGPTFKYPEIAYSKILVKTFAPAPQPLYMVGSATGGGMDPSKGLMLNEIAIGKLYSWRGNLEEGTFKLTYSKTDLLPSLNKGTTETSLVKRESASDPDDLFTVSSSGDYGVYVSVKDMKILYRRIPYPNVYLIGNATPAEWDLGKAVEFTHDNANPASFVLNVSLKEGELKILTKRDWGGETYRPLVADGSITDTKTQVYGGGNDLKWRVKGDQAGKYKIILNMYDNTINFVKQ